MHGSINPLSFQYSLVRMGAGMSGNFGREFSFLTSFSSMGKIWNGWITLISSIVSCGIKLRKQLQARKGFCG